MRDELESKHQSQATVIAKDLTQANSWREVYDELHGAGIQVEYLINNVDFGGRGKSHERDWEQDLAMIQLNVVTLTASCRFFVPEFVAQDSGRIQNVSSTASLLAGPLQVVYYAAKAYVTFLSNSLAGELHDTNAAVTALLPGATKTEFARTSGMDKTNLLKKTASDRSVAQDVYDGMLAGKLDVISAVTLAQRMMLGTIPFMPKKLLLRQVRKMQEVEEA